MTFRQKILFIGTFVILLVGRISIAGKGYLEDTDEWFYIWLHLHSNELPSFGALVKCVFDTQALFPEAAIRMLEYLSIKPIADLLGKGMLDPDILQISSIYNILSSLIVLYVFYRILIKLEFSVEHALVGVIILGTLFNYNIYTRHFLPYDHSLIFHLITLNLLLRKNFTKKTFLIAGICSAIGLSAYLGSFMFLFINGGFLLLKFHRNLKSLFKYVLLFILPHICVFGVYEILSQIYENRSYLIYLRDYSETVNMASFDEGFSYLFIYTHLVEKWWGIILLVLFFAGVSVTFFTSKSTLLKQLIGLGIIAYLSYGAYVYFSHKMVFHGRVLHPYFIFIVIGVLSLIHMPKKMLKYMAIPLVLVSLINYGFIINDFNQIAYPRNIIYKQKLFSQTDQVSIDYFQEINEGFFYDSFGSKIAIDSTSNQYLPDGHYKAVNIAFLKHFPNDFMNGYHAYTPQPDDSVLFNELHFQSHPAYALEYCTREGRNFYIEKKLHILVTKSK